MGEVVLTSENNDGDYNSEVSGDVNIINSNNEIMGNNNNDIVESKVLDSGEIEIVSEREKVIGCKGVVINIGELDNEWKESYIVGMKQRVNFPLIYDDSMCSQVLFLKGKSPVLVEDLSCLFFLYKFVPSVWSNIEGMIWHYDGGLDREWYMGRETELYKVKRDYNELKEWLNDMKYLPVKIERDVYKRQFCIL